MRGTHKASLAHTVYSLSLLVEGVKGAKPAL